MKLIIFLEYIISEIFGRNMWQKYSAQIFHIHEIMEKLPYIWNICAEYFWGIFHIYLNAFDNLSNNFVLFNMECYFKG